MSRARDILEQESIDYKFIGLKRPMPRDPVNKKPAGEANTSKVGIAMSENLLRYIDETAKEKFPDRKYPRSARVRQLIEAGKRAEEERAEGAAEPGEVLLQADAPDHG